MNSKLEKLIQSVSEHAQILKEYIDTYVNVTVDFDFVDELNEVIDLLNEVAFELESRASNNEE
jgi:hypothetical protein